MQVHPETRRQEADYTVTRKGVEHRIERFSIEVTIGKDRRRVACGPEFGGRFYIFDLAVRFSQGAKVWEASAPYWIEKAIVGRAEPRIDRRGNFSLVGFYEDFANKAVASQHNGA